VLQDVAREDIVAVSSVGALTAPGKFRFRFFLTAGAFLLVITVTGFAPTFFLAPLFDAPPLPPYLVIHGLFAAGWVLAFVAQAALISTSNVALHMRTGRLVALLGAGIVFSGLYVLYSIIKSADLPAELSRVSPGVWSSEHSRPLSLLNPIEFPILLAKGSRAEPKKQFPGWALTPDRPCNGG
jgi:hypothetical protein